MRKLVLVLALAMAVPAMAAVNFTAADAGDGVLAISYTTTDGDLPRGVALKVEVDNNGMVDFAGSADAALSANEAGFNTFIDYAYSNPVDFTIGSGHPYAKVGEAGALEADAAAAVISMGVLDEDGDETKGEAGPASADPLVNVLLKGDAGSTVTVTISADTMRGPDSGVVGSVLASNLPITVQVQIPGGVCEGLKPSEVAEWESVGSPESWCNPYQCHGDADGVEFSGKRVFGPDLNILIAGWNKDYSGDPLVDTWIAADFDRKVFSGKRVFGPDLNILIQYWNKADVPADCGVE